jgi:putative transposase
MNEIHRLGNLGQVHRPVQRGISDARKDIGEYLMDYYNRQRPHTFNDGMPPVVAEEKLKILSGIS